MDSNESNVCGLIFFNVYYCIFHNVDMMEYKNLTNLVHRHSQNSTLYITSSTKFEHVSFFVLRTEYLILLKGHKLMDFILIRHFY